MRNPTPTSTLRPWLMALAAIPLASLFGRDLLAPLRELIGRGNLGGVLGVVLAALALVALWRLWRSHGPQALLHLLWLVPLFLWLPEWLPQAEERLHLLLFGLFGYLSLSSLGVARAAFAVLAVALLDEGLQGLLPYRVGDWRDVLTNLLSGLGGALLACPCLKLGAAAPNLDRDNATASEENSP